MKNVRRIGQLLLYDLKVSIRSSWIKLLILAAITLAACMWLALDIESIRSLGFNPSPSYGDYVFYLFAGINYYPMDTQYPLPDIWLFIYVFFFYFTAYYPFNRMMDMGQQVLIRGEKRWIWWVEKEIWAFVMVLLEFATVWGVAAIYCMINKHALSLELNDTICRLNYGIEGASQAMPVESYALLLFVLIPYLTCAIIWQQQCFSLWLKPMFSMIISVGLLFLSIRIASPFLAGNYLMLLRYGVFASSGLPFIKLECTFWLATVIIVLTFVIGLARMYQMEFITKSE